MRKTLLILPAALLLGGCSSLHKKFHAADVSHDGKLSRAEFSDAVAKIAFTKYDTGKNGKVDLAEWQAVEGKDNDKGFALRDLNHTGKVSLPEAQQVARKNGAFGDLFNKVDTNHDECIDVNEVDAYVKAHPKPKR